MNSEGIGLLQGQWSSGPFGLMLLKSSQVDLIDMQSLPDGEFNWILVYQDHFTKFVSLRPLKRKCAQEVADAILDIFLTFCGAPKILQADNGREFDNAVLKNMVKKWPGLHLVHGRPRKSESIGSLEKENDLIKCMLRTWM